MAAESLVGCWRWSNNANIKVSANGMANNGFGSGPWSATGSNRYSIAWPDFTGSITLAADGQSLNAVDVLGVRSTAKRLQPGARDFPGVWQWDNGLIVTIANDGSMSAGNLRGTWNGSGRQYTIAWPIVDDIVVAMDGKSLAGQNQFGGFTATKQAVCP